MTPEFSFLVDREVHQIWVWGPVRLVFELGNGHEPEMYVDLQDCQLVGTNGVERPVNASKDAPGAGTMLQLLYDRTVSAHCRKGTLVLDFASGVRIEAHPDPEFESWSVIGEGRVHQCLPGGAVATW